MPLNTPHHMLILEVEEHQSSFHQVTLCGEKGKISSRICYCPPLFFSITEIVVFVADPSPTKVTATDLPN